MPATTTTTFLNLTLPVPTVRLGPAWASDIVTAFETIDSHDHTSGKGQQVPAAGLNINGNLDIQSNSLTDVASVLFDPVGATPSGSTFANGVSVYDGDLYFTNTSGTAVQITDGGSLVSSPGNAQIFETQSVGASLTISPSDTFVYLVVDTTADRTITLPLANAVSAGRIYIIKDSSGQSLDNNITLAAAGSDTIDGETSQTLNSNYGSWTIVGDGSSNWYIS